MRYHQFKFILLSGICLWCNFSLLGCSSYQKHFGGKGHEHHQAVSYTPLNFGGTKIYVNKSSRYAIPNVPGDSQEPTDYTIPPDYLNKDPQATVDTSATAKSNKRQK